MKMDRGASTRSNKKLPDPKEKGHLEEDTYINCLSAIIKRDFFPDLPLLEAQVDWLTAQENKDLLGMQLAQAKMEKIKDTQGEDFSKGQDIGDESFASGGYYSLDQFLSKYTSEDNASFDVILEKINSDRKRKYNWVKEKERESNQMNLRGMPQGEQMYLTQGASLQPRAIASICKEKADPVDSHGLIRHWKYTGKNGLMYTPDGEQSEVVDATFYSQNINHRNTRIQHQPSTTISAQLSSTDQLNSYSYIPLTSKETPRIIPGTTTPI